MNYQRRIEQDRTASRVTCLIVMLFVLAGVLTIHTASHSEAQWRCEIVATR